MRNLLHLADLDVTVIVNAVVPIDRAQKETGERERDPLGDPVRGDHVQRDLIRDDPAQHAPVMQTVRRCLDAETADRDLRDDLVMRRIPAAKLDRNLKDALDQLGLAVELMTPLHPKDEENLAHVVEGLIEAARIVVVMELEQLHAPKTDDQVANLVIAVDPILEAEVFPILSWVAIKAAGDPQETTEVVHVAGDRLEEAQHLEDANRDHGRLIAVAEDHETQNEVHALRDRS